MKSSNPFIFLDALRNRTPFVGRGSELKELKQACSRGSLQPVLLSGPQNSGKSSLIFKALFDYQEEILFATFNVPTPGNNTLLPKPVYWELYLNLKRRLIEPISDDEKAQFEVDPTWATERLIRETCRRFNRSLVLVVYNVERLYSAPTRPTYQNDQVMANGIFAFWWRLMQSVGNLSFVFVSETPALPNTPFTSALKRIQLKNLESKDVHNLLTTPNADFIPLFAPATVEYIYTLTNGQPYLVQMIAHGVTDWFNRELDKDNKPEPVFTNADVDAVLASDAFRQFGQPYVQAMRDRLPLDQPIVAAVLRTIARDEQGISQAGLDAALQGQYTWSDVEPVLASLEGQQIIKLNEEGRWQVVGELLRRELRGIPY